jgi:ribosomal protein S18 acetylase RimI-like enzyme
MQEMQKAHNIAISCSVVFFLIFAAKLQKYFQFRRDNYYVRFACLRRKISIFAAVTRRFIAMETEILTWSPELTPHFVRLNKQWIEHFFKLEECDYHTLGNPKGVIIDAGGQIFFARLGSEIVGCCALIHHPDNDTYELAKMAVDPAAQNCGAGFKLGTALVCYAKAHGVREIFLEANTKLAASVHLYRKLGFIPVENYHAAYDRCDLFMKLKLNAN